MIGRVIEIASEGQHLARQRGLMTVSCNGAETGRCRWTMSAYCCATPAA